MLASLALVVVVSAGCVRTPESLSRDALYIDVRSPGEYASGHIPGALNIELGKTDAMARAIGDKGRDVVVYCRSGRRSGKALEALKERGFRAVVNGGGVSGVARVLGVELERPGR